MSPPSSMSKGESDSSAKKKQLGIKRFFSPGSDGGDVVDNSEPAMRKRQSVNDTIRQLIQSGELEGVSLNETSVANIAEKVSANKPMNQGHHGKDQGHEGKKGGRPYMPNHLKRGIHGGATSNIRKKDEKPRKWELPISTKHEICKKLDGARSEFPDQCDLFNHFS